MRLNYELSTIYSEVFFFPPEKASLLTSSIFARILKIPQHCFMIIKKKKKNCKVSAMKCEQTRQKETKEVCTLLLKRSLQNLLPGITGIN